MFYGSAKKSHKYNAKRTIVNGKCFMSGLEGAVYWLLCLRAKAGEIKDIKCYRSFQLTPSVRWKVDFSYFCLKRNCEVAAEAKGKETADYLVKKNLWKDFGTMPLEIYKGTYRRPFLVETIQPSSQPIPSQK